MSSKEHQEKELAILRLEQQLSGIRSTLQSTEKDKLTLMGALRHAEECDPAPTPHRTNNTPILSLFLACTPCLRPLLAPLAYAPCLCPLLAPLWRLRLLGCMFGYFGDNVISPGHMLAQRRLDPNGRYETGMNTLLRGSSDGRPVTDGGGAFPTFSPARSPMVGASILRGWLCTLWMEMRHRDSLSSLTPHRSHRPCGRAVNWA